MRRKTRRVVSNIITLTCLAVLAVVVIFCVRAQFGSNDYLEWQNDGGSPPARPDDSATWNDDRWTKWRAEFEQWDRRRWSFHIRANPNAIFAFGRQRFYGYPRNSFNVHLYYWALIPALAVFPAIRLTAWTFSHRNPERGSVPCPSCGYDLRATPGRCPECGSEQSPGGAAAA